MGFPVFYLFAFLYRLYVCTDLFSWLQTDPISSHEDKFLFLLDICPLVFDTALACMGISAAMNMIF